jgi:hypothetical protein
MTDATASASGLAPNRDHQHGGMAAVGTVAQDIKAAMRSSKNWPALSPGHREALDMVAHKIARILSGADPHDREHWEDLVGYPIAALRQPVETIPEQ